MFENYKILMIKLKNKIYANLLCYLYYNQNRYHEHDFLKHSFKFDLYKDFDI